MMELKGNKGHSAERKLKLQKGEAITTLKVNLRISFTIIVMALLS